MAEEWVRTMLARGTDPIPAVDVGTGSRRHWRIRWDAYEEWYRKEERRGK